MAPLGHHTDAYFPRCQIQKRIQNSVQTCKMEHIVKIFIFLINSILDVQLASQYASEIFFSLVFFSTVTYFSNFL